MPRFARDSCCETPCTAAVDRSISRTLESVMQNKDLLWVRPDYAAGKIAPESPTQKSSKKQPQPFVDDGQDVFTVAQVASLLSLSPDTIRRLFVNEPGVIILGDEHPRRGHKRVTLRIPRAVFGRVKRKRARK